MVGVEEGREFRFCGDLYSQESTFPLVLIDSSTRSPVNVLMLFIQARRGLPRLHAPVAPGVVPCIDSFSRQFPCYLVV